jgi:hypothetical protein
MFKRGGEVVERDDFLVFLKVLGEGAEVRRFPPRMGQGNVLERVCIFGLVDANSGRFTGP